MPPEGAGGWHVLVFGPSLGQMGVVYHHFYFFQIANTAASAVFSHHTGFNNSCLLAAA